MAPPLLPPWLACLLCAVLGFGLGLLVGYMRSQRFYRRMARRRLW